MLNAPLTLAFFLFAAQCFSQTATTTDGNDSIVLDNQLIAKQKNNPPVIIKPSCRIYPNPARDKVTLQVNGFEPGMVSVKLINENGKPIREDNRLLINGNEDILMYLLLLPGTYYIILKQKERYLTRSLYIIN
jgi:hypothetical protein